MKAKSSQIVSVLLTTPKYLFLIDGLGGCFTVLCLLGILARYEPYFGVPLAVLHVLAATGTCCAVYSLVCYGFVGRRWRFFLKLIAFVNLAYCALTLGLMLWLHASLSHWGLLYFSLEILIISSLAFVELRLSDKAETNY